MSPDEIDGVVRRIQGGDRAPFGDLIVEIQRDLRIFVAAHAPSADVVEEIMQASFVTAFESIADYDPRGTFGPWLKGIARNLLRRELHERRRQGRRSGDILDRAVADQCLIDLEEREESDGEMAKLRECLAALPSRQRELIERRYSQQLPLNVLAQQFKRNAAHLSVLLYRIRGILRACLEGKGLEA
ncbi:MAG: sigma-70 family RNA polymerase sigma factor [Planctomycetes bacterium]|nr:sigma-70 family RNA polymerase sigma factor [Planctomycetota bacterium]